MKLQASNCVVRPYLFMAAAILCPTLHGQTPMLEYLFNGTGTEAVSSGSAAVNLPMFQWDGTSAWAPGDNHGAEGTGVSGLTGDRAYQDLSVALDLDEAAASPSPHYHGGYAGNVVVAEAEVLPALTVQGWFRSAAGQPIGSQGTYEGLVGNLGSSQNDGGWVVRGTNVPGTLELRFGEDSTSLNHEFVTTTAGAFSETDEWLFFAATLDAATGSIQFFKGTTSTAVIDAGSGSSSPLVGGIITDSNRNFFIGNSASESGKWSRGRAFDGLIDNVRVFNGILTPTELETLRLADLTPSLGLAGDFNGDGSVDAADYIVWRNNLGEPEGTLLSGNGDGGTVDTSDYSLWKSSFGAPGALELNSIGMSNVVPESGTWVLFLGAIFAGVIALRRRGIWQHALV